MTTSGQALAKSAQSVQEVLQTKGVACKVVELSTSARTAQEAADALGCDVMFGLQLEHRMQFLMYAAQI